MPDSADHRIDHSGAGPAEAAAGGAAHSVPQQVPSPRPARVAAAAIAWAAVLALSLAIVVNWLWAPSVDAASQPEGGTGGDVAAVALFEPETPAIELIPERILQFETISHHGVPGMGTQGAEAVYKTLNMNIEARIEIVVYARVEAFESAVEAKARLDELMAPYSQNRTQTTLNGVTPGMSGEKADGSAYAVGWLKGNNATMVKASFAEWTPKNKVDLLSYQADKVVSAVDIYQRTGRQGVSK